MANELPLIIENCETELALYLTEQQGGTKLSRRQVHLLSSYAHTGLSGEVVVQKKQFGETSLEKYFAGQEEPEPVLAPLFNGLLRAIDRIFS